VLESNGESKPLAEGDIGALCQLLARSGKTVISGAPVSGLVVDGEPGFAAEPKPPKRATIIRENPDGTTTIIQKGDY